MNSTCRNSTCRNPNCPKPASPNLLGQKDWCRDCQDGKRRKKCIYDTSCPNPPASGKDGFCRQCREEHQDKLRVAKEDKEYDEQHRRSLALWEDDICLDVFTYRGDY